MQERSFDLSCFHLLLEDHEKTKILFSIDSITEHCFVHCLVPYSICYAYNGSVHQYILGSILHSMGIFSRYFIHWIE